MPCYYPMTAYQGSHYNQNGKRPLVFTQPNRKGYARIEIACGQCVGCRLERSRQWATRIMHEAQMHKETHFLTLTYRDDKLVWGKDRPTLCPDHLKNFWKRYRKEIAKDGKCLRYFACGEYGSKFARPHYHACVFGHDFQDRKLYSVKNGNNIYSSELADSLWTHGDCRLGSLTFESAAYVARYIVDKHTGKDAGYYNEEGIYPEFVRMSLKPGIGSTWLEKFETDVYPRGKVVLRHGVETNPPKYYDNKKALDNPELIEYLKKERREYALKNPKEKEWYRLKAKEALKKMKLRKHLNRPYTGVEDAQDVRDL